MIRVGRRVLGPYAGVSQQFCDDVSRALQDLAALPVNGLQRYTPRINAAYPGLDAGLVDEVRQAFQTAGLLMSAQTEDTRGMPVIRRSFTPRPGVPRELTEDLNRLFQVVHGQFTPGEVRRVSIVRPSDVDRTTDMTIPSGSAKVTIYITGSTTSGVTIELDDTLSSSQSVTSGETINIPDGATAATVTMPEDEGISLEWFFGRDVGTTPVDYPAMILADGPLHYWRMDETSGTTLYDNVGDADITISGATINQTGQVGPAVDFDGTDDYGEATIDLSAATTVYVEFWVRPDAYSVDVLLNFAGSVADTPGAFFINCNAGPWLDVIKRNSAGNNAARYAQSVMPIGEWTHVVIVIPTSAGASVDLYINGALATPASRPFTDTGAQACGNATLRVMRSFGDTIYYADGAIQHLAIYDTLSEAQIAEHYAAGIGT